MLSLFPIKFPGGVKVKSKIQIKPYFFIFPSFVFMCLFFYYPVFYAVYCSFTDYRLGTAMNFVGLDNYFRLFQDRIFLIALKNQALFTAADIFKSIFFPLLAAEILFFIRNRSLANKFKTMFVIPMLVPGIVSVLMWGYIYNYDFGAINSFLQMIGLESWRHAWLLEEGTALVSLIFIGFPFVSGLNFLILYSGLSTISIELGEAARLDGCATMGIVRHIHLPLVTPFISAVAILTAIGSLQDYAKILVTTGGGPGAATYIPALYMYKAAFADHEMGYASSAGVVIFIILILLTIISMKISKKD